MAHRNYYLMLGLSFDPPEERSEEIKKAIEKKQHEWSRGTMDFRKGPIFREYMALLPDIERVMKDQVLRKNEAREAKEIKIREISSQLSVVSKRGYLFASEVQFIAERCLVPVEMVEKLCPVPVRQQKSEVVGLTKRPEFDHYLVYLVYLEALQKKDYYDYVRQERAYDKVRNLPSRELLRMVNRMENEQGKYTATESANEKICAECKRTFASEEEKKVYDQYLEWQDIQAVFKQVDVATYCTKVLEKEQREEALRLLNQACGDKKRAIQLLDSYMEQEHIRFADGETVDVPKEKPLFTTSRSMHYKEKPEPVTESASRASGLYPKVVKIREEMSLNHYEEANSLLKDAFAHYGELPELMRIQDQLTSRKQKLYSMLNGINENMDKKYYHTANLELIHLKEEFPAYQNPLMESKISQGLLTGKHLFEQAEVSRQEESIVTACMDALEVCADYPGVMKLLEKYPPRLYGSVRVTADSIHQCNYIQWTVSRQEPYIRYIVLRKKDARPYHNKDGVTLATVEENSFVDHSIVAGEKYYYGIYAIRCGVVSNGLMATSGCINYCEVINHKIVAKQDGIEITWDRIPTGARIEIYRGTGYVPTHPSEGELIHGTTTWGCYDQNVIPGEVYGYRIFTVYIVNGEKQYSTGIPLRITSTIKGYSSVTSIHRRQERIHLTYYFEVKKIFLYSHKILLHIEADENVTTLPPLLVVGDVVQAPVYKTSGQVVAMIPSGEIDKEMTFDIRYKEIGACRYLNLFLQRMEDNSAYQLSLKSGKSLRVVGTNLLN